MKLNNKTRSAKPLPQPRASPSLPPLKRPFHHPRRVNPNTPSSSHSSSTFQTSSSSPLHLRTIPNAIHFDPLVIGNHSTPGLCILPMPISSSSSSTTGIHPFIKLDTPIPLRSSEDSVADRSLVFRLVQLRGLKYLQSLVVGKDICPICEKTCSCNQPSWNMIMQQIG